VSFLFIFISRFVLVWTSLVTHRWNWESLAV